MNATKEQLELAKTMWEQARDRTALIAAAEGRLKESKHALIESIKALGVSHLEATKQFQKYLDTHLEELGKAAKDMNETSELYGALYRKYREQKSP